MKLSQKALGWLGGGVTGLLNGLFGSGGGMVAVPLLEHGGLEPAGPCHFHCGDPAPHRSQCRELSVFRVGGFFGGSALPPRRSAGVLVGSRLLGKLSSTALSRIFGVLILFAAGRMWLS